MREPIVIVHFWWVSQSGRQQTRYKLGGMRLEIVHRCPPSRCIRGSFLHFSQQWPTFRRFFTNSFTNIIIKFWTKKPRLGWSHDSIATADADGDNGLLKRNNDYRKDEKYKSTHVHASSWVDHNKGYRTNGDRTRYRNTIFIHPIAIILHCYRRLSAHIKTITIDIHVFLSTLYYHGWRRRNSILRMMAGVIMLVLF